jgi:hypothetical protein
MNKEFTEAFSKYYDIMYCFLPQSLLPYLWNIHLIKSIMILMIIP